MTVTPPAVDPAVRCTLCRHREDQHETLPDGTRPCRSIGHEKGLTCTECRRLIGAEHFEAVMALRDEPDDQFEVAWAAYYATFNHARDEIGPGWQAFFTDVHQSAVASAILAYRAEEEAQAAPPTGPACPLPRCGWVYDGPMPADGVGVWPGPAARRELAAAEEVVGEHLDTHTVGDWAAALMVTRAELERERTDTAHLRERLADPTEAEQAATKALEAAMRRLRTTCDAYNVGDDYGKTFVPGLSRAVEVVQRVMLEGPSVPPDLDATEQEAAAWGAVWQHGTWYEPTREMPPEARERAAAAVLRWMHALDAADGRPPRDEPKGLRWWRTPGTPG